MCRRKSSCGSSASGRACEVSSSGSRPTSESPLESSHEAALQALLVTRGTDSAAESARFAAPRVTEVTGIGWDILAKLGSSPALDPPLQRPQLSIGEFARAVSLQRLEQRHGLRSRVRIDLLADRFPDPFERVGPGSPGAVPLVFARQSALAQILPGRLGIHPRLGGREFLGPLCLRQPLQPPDLCVGNHLRSAPAGANFDGR